MTGGSESGISTPWGLFESSSGSSHSIHLRTVWTFCDPLPHRVSSARPQAILPWSWIIIGRWVRERRGSVGWYYMTRNWTDLLALTTGRRNGRRLMRLLFIFFCTQTSSGDAYLGRRERETEKWNEWLDNHIHLVVVWFSERGEMDQNVSEFTSFVFI